MYIYIYIYTYIHVYIYIYIYTHIHTKHVQQHKQSHKETYTLIKHNKSSGRIPPTRPPRVGCLCVRVFLMLKTIYIYIYIYIYTHIHKQTHTHIYIYIEREREIRFPKGSFAQPSRSSSVASRCIGHGARASCIPTIQMNPGDVPGSSFRWVSPDFTDVSYVYIYIYIYIYKHICIHLM